MSHSTSSGHIEEVDPVVKVEPKMMVKEEMTGGKREQGRKKGGGASIMTSRTFGDCLTPSPPSVTQKWEFY